MVYGNVIRQYPREKLTKIPRWRERGLTYWKPRYDACQQRVYAADSASQLSRAINDLRIAEAAVLELMQIEK